MKRLCICTLLLFLPLFSLAKKNDVYQVSLVVFQEPLTNPQSLTDWLTPSDTFFENQDSNSIALPSSFFSTLGAPYNLMQTEYSNLLTEAKRLRRSRDFHVILDVTWRQPLLSEKQVVPIQISTEKFQFDNAIDEKKQHWEIEGKITLSKNTYLHIDTDLLLTPTDEDAAKGIDLEGQSINFKSGRAFREGQVLLLQNPMFGLLIKVTKQS